MEKTKKIQLLSTILLFGFALGVIYHYIMGHYLNIKDLSDSFLYPTSYSFCDFFGIFDYIKDFKPYQETTLWIVYFPLAYLFLIPFAFVKNAVLSYLLFISGFVFYFIYMNIKNFYCKNLDMLQNIQNIFILTFLSYPFLYNIDKGNFDMWLFILLGLWAYAFNSKKYLTSSILLALINAIKPFTIFVLLLYLLKKKYREFFLSVTLSAFLIIGGFMLFPDNFWNQIIVFIKTLKLFKFIYALGPEYGLGYCSSIFTPLKILILHISTNDFFINMFVKIYNYCAIALTLITMFFVWREKSFWKQLTLLFSNFILLPYVTYDYKLIFLYIPLWFFINEKEKSKLDVFYIILFGLLFIPKNIILNFNEIIAPIPVWTSLSAIINPIILILFSLLIIYEQFSQQKEEA